MALDNTKNFSKSLVSGTYNNSATAITLASGGGAKMPTAPFQVTWWDAGNYPDPSSDPLVEIVRVTAVIGDILTVTRGQESTSASNKNTGSTFYLMIAGMTAKMITDLANASNLTSGTLAAARLSGAYTGINGVGTLTAGNIGSNFGNIAGTHLYGVNTDTGLFHRITFRNSTLVPGKIDLLWTTSGTALT